MRKKVWNGWRNKKRRYMYKLILGGWIYMEQLHNHNQRTYENICRMYDEGIQRIAVVQPTGSGKSLLMAKLIEDNPNNRFFVLSTSHKINDQFQSKLDDKMLERSNFNIYCNMPNMKQEVMESLQPDYIFLDEMHRALAKEWSKGINVLLNMYPNVKVLGLSATPIRYLDRCRNVAEELFGGNLACDMSLSQAILDGILPMARYVCGVYSYEKDAESLNKKIEKSSNSDEEKKELLRQVKILKENLDKGHGVSDIFRKYIVTGSEKFAVFLKDTTHLRIMKPVIEKWFTDAGFTVRLYEVHSKNADKDKEFQKFKEDTEDGIIKACLSVNMIAEGIHGDIDGVIMLRDTISPNMYFQMIGRAFACGKKTIPLIFDLVANSQFISDAVDNFPNELRGEIEKRKEECEKEGKEYEVGFDVDEFIVMDEFMDVVSGFREIEGRLCNDWENGLKHFDKYIREHNGDVLVPFNYKDEDGFDLGGWVQRRRTDFRNKNLSEDRFSELEKRNFIWDIIRFNFENKVKIIAEYYEKYKKYPLIKSSGSIGNFISTEKTNMRNEKENYPEWKKEILEKYLPDFSCENRLEKSFNEFIHYAKVFKDKYGHTDIKRNDVIDSFNIGNKLYVIKSMYDGGRLSSENLKVLDELGIKFQDFQSTFSKKMELARCAVKAGVKICPTNPNYNGVNLYHWVISTVRNKYEKNELNNTDIELIEKLIGRKIDNSFGTIYQQKYNLCKQAVNEGVIINEHNQKYKGTNLYNWINVHKKRFSEDELKIINMLMPNKKYITNKIIDIAENKVVGIFKTLEEAVHFMRETYGVELCRDGISKRLKGKTTTPYKGRFMFYYATDEEVKKYFDDGKAS